MRETNRGFTIIELMIVIGVIGLLVLVIVPKAANVKSSAKEAGLSLDMTYIQGHLMIQINRYDLNHRIPPQSDYNYNSSYLAGKMENILELGEKLINNDYNNFDGYQNPYSGSKVILNYYLPITSLNSSFHQPAVFITGRNEYHHNEAVIYPSQLKGTIMIFMQNQVDTVEVFYIDHNGKASHKLTITS